MGYKKDIKHLDGRIVSLIGTEPVQPFAIKKVEKEGMPHHNYASIKGDLYVKQKVRLPKSLTEEEKLLIERIF